MDKRQLKELMPHNKDDGERAKRLASLGYASVKPVAYEMLQWLRTYESPVAAVFIAFFIRNGAAAVDEVHKALITTRQAHLKYVIVTRVLPEWPRPAVEMVTQPLTVLVTNSGEPETALMALRLLAKHDLYEKDWLRSWLDFVTERMERNLREARQIAEVYF